MNSNLFEKFHEYYIGVMLIFAFANECLYFLLKEFYTIVK